MTFGVSHDTAEFACECFAQQWEENLRHIYPSVKTILILCDGGGSNNARSWQFKWWLIKLAKRLGVNIRIAHYSPYCSKWNPIEHRLFSQISRVWSGAVFNTIEEACELASRARTKTGLAVFTLRKQFQPHNTKVPPKVTLCAPWTDLSKNYFMSLLTNYC